MPMELVGLDIAQHGERAYVFDFASPGAILDVSPASDQPAAHAEPEAVQRPTLLPTDGGGAT